VPIDSCHRDHIDLTKSQDLSVQTDGEFILRYRVFDLYSRDADRHSCDAIIQAEVYGKPFKVYSTKEFPGLPPSTELTKVSGHF
jgi:hypothetical protein